MARSRFLQAQIKLMRRVQHAVVRLLRFVVAAVWRFHSDACLLHASALAYVSLLSLVPLFAVMFAVLKGLGVQRRIEPLLLSRLALDPAVADRIVTYIDRTNVGTLGALGAAVLVVTVISVLGNIEASFNHIWRVRQGRTWWRKVTDYLSTVLVTPFLLLAAVAITSSLQEQALLRLVLNTEYVGDAVLQVLRLAPLVMNAAALAILYAIMPNRRPYVPGILVGAVTAGCAWQVVQSAYVRLQIGMARYNAIYGALSQLPVMLVWLYVSWVVVLAGAVLAAECEFGAGGIAASAAPTSRWAIALHVLLQAMERFRSQGGGIDVRAIARGLRLEGDIVAQVAETLQEGGLLVAVDGQPSCYLLARDPHTVSLAELDGLMDADTPPAGCDPRVTALINDTTAERRHSWQHRFLADLFDDARTGESADQHPS
jgi:membrane protein